MNSEFKRSNICMEIPTFQTSFDDFKKQLNFLETDINKIINTDQDNLIFKSLPSKNTAFTGMGSNKISDLDMPNFMNNSLNPQHLSINEYQKPENLLSNNISNNTFTEILQEYSIIVDSSDRDINKYPNPFNYRVYFNPVNDTTDAYIPQKFNYVKYIKLVTGILPTLYYYIKIDATINDNDITLLSNLTYINNPPNSEINLTSINITGIYNIINISEITQDNINYKKVITFAEPQEYPTVIKNVYEFSYTYNYDDNKNMINKVLPVNNYITQFQLQSFNLSSEKYTLLYIKEYSPPNENSTNQIVSNAFSIMFPDGVNCETLYTSTNFVDKVFKFSNLGILNQLTISILNSDGNLLKNSKISYTDFNLPINKNCDCLTETTGIPKRNYQCCCTYFRHPYYKKFQNILIFKIGVIENAIDTNIFN